MINNNIQLIDDTQYQIINNGHDDWIVFNVGFAAGY